MFYKVASLFFLCLGVLSPEIISGQRTSTQVIQTRSGPIVGTEIPLRDAIGDDVRVKEFLAIPYAKPPVGELRFAKPQPVHTWQVTYEAVNVTNTCLQYDYEWTRDDLKGSEFYTKPGSTLSEDCLYLNMWVPSGSGRRLPRMASLVFIHGGGFNVGSSALKLYDGKVLAASREVIVVTIQYRLGAFGFLSLGIDEAPGNMGLLDQQMALKWLHENVVHFGGDPNRITIFGESAGGASVNYHLLSETSRRYFKRGIMQSGSATASWASLSADKLKEVSLERAAVAGCPNDDDDLQAVLDCLREADAKKITEGEGVEEGSLPLHFRPALQKNFLAGTPNELMNRNLFKRTDLMLGTNSESGTMLLNFVLPNVFKSSGEFEIDEKKYRETFDALFPGGSKVQYEALGVYFRNWQTPNSSDAFVDSLNGVGRDFFFTCPMLKVAEKYVEANEPTYFFYFAYKGSLSVMKEWAGATHNDELHYIFGVPKLLRLNSNSEEVALSEMMMTYWANFAQTGNPNTGQSGGQVSVHWPRRTRGAREYLTLTANPRDMKIGSGPHEDNCAVFEYLDRVKLDEDDCPSSARRLTPAATSLVAISIFCWFISQVRMR